MAGIPKGHIHKVWIENFMGFQGRHEVELNPRGTGSIVALCGANGSGKTSLLHMLACTNVLRADSTKCDHFNCPGPQCEGNRRCQLCLQNTGDQEDLLRESMPCCHHTLWKTQPNKEALLKVETNDADGGLVYYGLYASNDEGSKWAWHQEPNNASAAFVFYQGRLILRCRQENLNRFGDRIKEALGLGHIVPESFERLHVADQKKIIDILPTAVLDHEILLKAREFSGESRNLYAVLEMMNAKNCSSCMLIPNVMSDNSYYQNGWRKLFEKCQETRRQLITTEYSPQELLKTHPAYIGSIIRLWRNIEDGRRLLLKADAKFREAYRRGPDESEQYLAAALTYSSILLVEGRSDRNALRPAFNHVLSDWSMGGAGLREMLRETLIIPVNGKSFLVPWVKHLLSYATSLQLPFFIICDGDAIRGWGAKHMKGSFEYEDGEFKHKKTFDLKHDSSILCKNAGQKKKVLAVVKNQMSAENHNIARQIFPVLYRRLKAQNGAIDEKRYEVLLNEINNKWTLTEAWRFCSEELYVFAWKYGNCDLESVITQAGQNPIPNLKQRLMDPVEAVRIVRQELNMNNPDVRRLSLFLWDNIRQMLSYFCDAHSS